MRSIAVFLNLRKCSSRCKNKLLRPYSNTSLFRIAVDKLSKLKTTEKYICAYDEDFFYDIPNNIDLIKRSPESANCDLPLSLVFEAISKFKSEYAMFVNPCHAHMTIETLQTAINTFTFIDAMSATSVESVGEWLLDNDSNLIVPRCNFTGDTKKTEKLNRVAHAFHIFNIKRFLDSEKLWTFTKNDPFLFKISKIEAIDIDDDDDFLVSESVYKNFRNQVI